MFVRRSSRWANRVSILGIETTAGDSVDTGIGAREALAVGGEEAGAAVVAAVLASCYATATRASSINPSHVVLLI